MLAAGAGALAAVLTAEALARPAPGEAADGDNMIVGQLNIETSATAVQNSNLGAALSAFSEGSGTGVVGISSGGDGVHGQSNGNSGNGVHGEHGADGNGVFGHAKNSGASGVYGQNDGAGFGVAGRAVGGVGALGDSANGVGVWASSQNATALKVTGKAQFSRSGVLSVTAGHASATQTGVHLTSASLVLATLQQDRPGVWVRSAVPKVSAHSFTVHLSKPVSARTTVAWFVLD